MIPPVTEIFKTQRKKLRRKQPNPGFSVTGPQSILVDTKFANRSSSGMAGTAMPRSHRGTGVSPVTDWVVYGYSLSLPAPLLRHSPGRRDAFSCAFGRAPHM